MPQNKHCNIRRRDVGIISVSGPVDVMAPFDVFVDGVDGEIVSVVTVIEFDNN